MTRVPHGTTDPAPPIEMTFIGHQSWLFSAGGTNALIDPILGATFGNSIESRFAMEIYPPRRVALDRLPRIDAVLLSHEHIDHFHLASLACLDRRTPVFVGVQMLDSVVTAIEALGFGVTRCPLRAPFAIGAFHCALYPAGAADLAHERRVSQMYLWTDPACNVYNTVDAVLSPALVRDVAAGRVPAPRNVILSNNGMVPSDGARRAYYNISDRSRDSRQGISLFRGLFDGIAGLSGLDHVFLMGDGILPWGGEYGPFLWSDNAKLAALLSELSRGPVVLGPYPGDQYTVAPELATGRASWVELDRERFAALRRLGETAQHRPAAELPVLTRAFASDAEARQAVAAVEAGLGALAAALLAMPFGQALQTLDDPGYPGLGPRRLALRLQGGPEGRPVQYALDINRAAFVRDDTPVDRLVEAFPHGLEMQLCDFLAVLEGRLLIWDLYFAPVRGWFLETEDNSVDCLLTALSLVYGEQAHPELARAINERAIRGLSQPRTRGANTLEETWKRPSWDTRPG